MVAALIDGHGEPPVRAPRAEWGLGTSVVLHRFEKNIFQRVAPEVEPADSDVAFARQPIDIANFNAIGEDHLHAVGRNRALAAQPFDGFSKVTIGPIDLSSRNRRLARRSSSRFE